MAIDPAAISARPAVMITLEVLTAPDNPAARANGTVNPSDMPMTMSRTVSPAVKCFSTCGDVGILWHPPGLRAAAGHAAATSTHRPDARVRCYGWKYTIPRPRRSSPSSAQCSTMVESSSSAAYSAGTALGILVERQGAHGADADGRRTIDRAASASAGEATEPRPPAHRPPTGRAGCPGCRAALTSRGMA